MKKNPSEDVIDRIEAALKRHREKNLIPEYIVLNIMDWNHYVFYKQFICGDHTLSKSRIRTYEDNNYNVIRIEDKRSKLSFVYALPVGWKKRPDDELQDKYIELI